MSLMSFSNSASWELTIGSRSKLILTYHKFFLEPRLILVSCSSFVIVQLIMQRFWTHIQASVTIFPTLGFKKKIGRCYLKVSWSIVIWTHSTNIDSTCISYRTCSTNTSVIKFKLVDRIKLIGCSNLIGVGTTMVPMKTTLVPYQTLSPFLH
jgi:hypothetical protein